MPVPSPRAFLVARQVRNERAIPLDSAHYLAVSTGRLDPYLRALAHGDVWTLDPITSIRTSDGLTFIEVWATKARAQLAAYERDLKPRVAVCVVATLNPQDAGVRIDPGRATELSIEPHHRSTISTLADGEALPEALTAIASEELQACASFRADDSAASQVADEIEAQVLPLLSEGHTLTRVDVELTVSPAPGPSHPVYFVRDEDGAFPSLTNEEAIAQALGPSRVLVNPGNPSWRRDLLWDQRVWARDIMS